MPDISTLTFPALYDDEGPPRCLTPEPIAPDTPRFTLRNWVTRGTERTLLDRLPVEMITYIRSFIPHGYLFTHLAFYWSCDFVNSIYKKDDRFWSKVCTAYGIGKPLDHPLATFTWRELAITIAEHQVQCFETTCWGQVEIGMGNCVI